MGAMASQITSLTIVYSTVYSGADQRKHQSSMSLVFVRGIHRWPVNSPHKWPVARKMSPFDDVIMPIIMQDAKAFMLKNIIYRKVQSRKWLMKTSTKHIKQLSCAIQISNVFHHRNNLELIKQYNNDAVASILIFRQSLCIRRQHGEEMDSITAIYRYCAMPL